MFILVNHGHRGYGRILVFVHPRSLLRSGNGPAQFHLRASVCIRQLAVILADVVQEIRDAQHGPASGGSGGMYTGWLVPDVCFAR